jgi:hypothetical protein
MGLLLDLVRLVEGAAVVVHHVGGQRVGVLRHGAVQHDNVLGMSGTAGDIVGVPLHVELVEGLHVGGLVLDHLQLVLGSTCLVEVAELDIAVDIVSILLPVRPVGGLHVGALVLDLLQVVLGDAQPVGVTIGLHVNLGKELLVLAHLDRLMPLEGGRCGTEGVVGHGDGHILGAGLPVWRSGGQLGGALGQLDLVRAVMGSWGHTLLETDSGRAIVPARLGAVMAGEVPGVVDVPVETGPVVVIVAVTLSGAAVYMPSSSPGVAVGPDQNLFSGVYHLVSAVWPDRGRCSHHNGGGKGPNCWSPWRTWCCWGPRRVPPACGWRSGPAGWGSRTCPPWSLDCPGSCRVMQELYEKQDGEE